MGLLRRFWDVAVTSVVYFLLSLGVHEFFHYQAATALGFTAAAHWPTWISGLVFIEGNPDPLSLGIIGIAGGLGVALLFWLLSYFTKDWEQDLILGFFVPFQVSYAILEVFYLLGYLPINALSISALPGAIYLVRRLQKSGYF